MGWCMSPERSRLGRGKLAKAFRSVSILAMQTCWQSSAGEAAALLQQYSPPAPRDFSVLDPDVQLGLAPLPVEAEHTDQRGIGVAVHGPMFNSCSIL